MTKEEFKAGVLFLHNVKNDYQFNPNDPGYLGFLNCGEDITDDPGFMIVVDNQEEFEPTMDDIKGTATRLLVEAQMDPQDVVSMGTGGFRVYKLPWGIELTFSIVRGGSF